jgi:hypothetical protein
MPIMHLTKPLPNPPSAGFFYARYLGGSIYETEV